MIADFDVNGGDVIDLAHFMNGLTFSSFADIEPRISEVDGNAVIDLGSGNTITLVGVDSSQLTAAMFGFNG